MYEPRTRRGASNEWPWGRPVLCKNTIPMPKKSLRRQFREWLDFMGRLLLGVAIYGSLVAFAMGFWFCIYLLITKPT